MLWVAFAQRGSISDILYRVLEWYKQTRLGLVATFTCTDPPDLEQGVYLIFFNYGKLQILPMGFHEIKIARPISVTLTIRYLKCLIKFTYLNKSPWYETEKEMNTDHVICWSEQISSSSPSYCLCCRIAKLILVSRLNPRSRPGRGLAFCDMVVWSLPSQT